MFKKTNSKSQSQSDTKKQEQEAKNPSESQTFYDLLGLKTTASQDEIRKAWKSLAQKHHPDKDPENLDLFRSIREAYQVLSDPARRAAYDCGLRQGINPAEFQSCLMGMVEKLVLRSLAKLDAFEGSFGGNQGTFKAEVLSQIDQVREQITDEQKTLKKKESFLLRHIESIEVGLETRIGKSLLKKKQEISSLIQSQSTQLAVLDFIEEEAETLICDSPQQPQPMQSFPTFEEMQDAMARMRGTGNEL